MRVAVCRFDETMDTEQAMAWLLQAGLPTAECERLREIRHPSARAASVAARLALLWALADGNGDLTVHRADERPPVLGVPLSGFYRSERGPMLDGQALGISFAHSAPFAVCAVTERRRVGVDVERLDRVHRLPDAYAPLFSEGERGLLDAATDRSLAFLRIWTRKEALGKALGTGLANSREALDTTAHRFLEYTVEGALISVIADGEEVAE